MEVISDMGAQWWDDKYGRELVQLQIKKKNYPENNWIFNRNLWDNYSSLLVIFKKKMVPPRN